MRLVAMWIILCKSFSGFGVANFLPLNNFINSFVPFVAVATKSQIVKEFTPFSLASFSKQSKKTANY
jgi:hypothetical protein